MIARSLSVSLCVSLSRSIYTSYLPLHGICLCFLVHSVYVHCQRPLRRTGGLAHAYDRPFYPKPIIRCFRLLCFALVCFASLCCVAVLLCFDGHPTIGRPYQPLRRRRSRRGPSSSGRLRSLRQARRVPPLGRLGIGLASGGGGGRARLPGRFGKDCGRRGKKHEERSKKKLARSKEQNESAGRQAGRHGEL